MKPILVIIFFLFIALVSCKKTEEINIYDDLANCCFKIDTYWVYFDSVSSNIDSTYVVFYNHYFKKLHITDNSYNNVEYFTFTTRSSSNTESVEYKIVSNVFLKNDIYIIYKDYNSTSDGVASNDYIFQHLDSLYVYNQYYYRVLKVEEPGCNIETGYKNIFYCNSEYGILRHDIFNDSVMVSQKLLIRKNIIR